MNKYAGYINHGSYNISADDTLATESLVSLIVGLKKFFKVPIGYFLIDKITAAQQAQMLRDAIIHVTNAGFNVEALTCNGSYTNQTTARSLGCCLDADSLVCSFPHPQFETKTIASIMDACHMLKNIRNAFGDWGVLKHGEDFIDWKFGEALHKLQSS